MTLGEKIQALRKRAGMSQEELAGALGVSRQAVSRWETGETMPELPKLLALSRALGVTADWLISDGAPRDPESPREPEGQSASAPPPEGDRRPGWVDSLPGPLGAIVRRFGWMAGVYLALSGAAMAALGGAARWVARTLLGPSQGVPEVVHAPSGAPRPDALVEWLASLTAVPVDTAPALSWRVLNGLTWFAVGLGGATAAAGVLLLLAWRRGTRPRS